MERIASENRVGLAVMDVQTLHNGHVGMLRRMLDAGLSASLVALGSVNQHGKEGHPFTFEQRIAMIEAVFGKGAFRFVGLRDIDATAGTDDWLDYVLSRIASHRLPAPTDYFSGSEIDASWYESHFGAVEGPSRAGVGIGSEARVYEDRATGRRIHVVARENNSVPSGRHIRTMIERRKDDWRLYVPLGVHAFVEWNYPPHLRLPLRGQAPDPASIPVGTRFVEGVDKRHGAVVLELKDDLKWRPVAGPDEKERHAILTRTGQDNRQ